jgi:hypothetical protein
MLDSTTTGSVNLRNCPLNNRQGGTERGRPLDESQQRKHANERGESARSEPRESSVSGTFKPFDTTRCPVPNT